MNKFSKIAVRLVFVTQIFTLTLLAACSFAGGADTASSSTACRATGDPKNPYEKITVMAYPNEELAYPNDISPVPVNGCPSNPMVIKDGKIAICHATGNTAKPYEEMLVGVNGLDGHGTHKDDVFPAAEGGCPTTKQ